MKAAAGGKSSLGRGPKANANSEALKHKEHRTGVCIYPALFTSQKQKTRSQQRSVKKIVFTKYQLHCTYNLWCFEAKMTVKLTILNVTIQYIYYAQ